MWDGLDASYTHGQRAVWNWHDRDSWWRLGWCWPLCLTSLLCFTWGPGNLFHKRLKSSRTFSDCHPLNIILGYLRMVHERPRKSVTQVANNTGQRVSSYGHHKAAIPGRTLSATHPYSVAQRRWLHTPWQHTSIMELTLKALLESGAIAMDPETMGSCIMARLWSAADRSTKKHVGVKNGDRFSKAA